MADTGLGLTFTDAVILAAVVAAGLKVLADYRGWTRSPALVRQENADLRERIATLAAEVDRLSKANDEKGQQLAAQQRELEVLRERDQAAVLAAVAQHDQSMAALGAALAQAHEQHEERASDRSEKAQARHEEFMSVWNDIRDMVVGRERTGT